jgi:hypothetical protein
VFALRWLTAALWGAVLDLVLGPQDVVLRADMVPPRPPADGCS